MTPAGPSPRRPSLHRSIRPTCVFDADGASQRSYNRGVSSKRFTRVAVVQLDYHPAAIYDGRALIDDPLGELRETIEVPDGLLEALSERRGALGKRIREAYLDALVVKLRGIVRACVRWGVEVLVFPEYSIPWQVLEEVAKEAAQAPNMLVVAGTHAVSRSAREVYERLGWPRDHMPAQNTAVAPVIREGRLVALVGKLSPSKVEEDSKVFERSRAWAPIPAGPFGSLAVLICIDFLYRENESHRAVVGEPLEQARLCAVPALSPWHTRAEFVARAREDAERYGRPVLLANIARDGGSSIFVDDDPKAPPRSFPGGVGALGTGEEGVIVADVDLGFVRSGEHTKYDAVRSVRPYAAASLVYRNTAELDDYATWVEEFSGRLEQQDVDLEQVIAELRHVKPMLMRTAKQAGAPTRSARLWRLFEDEEFEHVSIERIRELTREVVLSEGVLPLVWVRYGLAHGARQVVKAWQRSHEVGLDQALERLSKALGSKPREKTLPAADAALGELVSAVWGSEGEATDQKERLGRDVAIEVLVAQLSADDGEMERKIIEGRLHEAQTDLDDKIAATRKALDAAPGTPALLAQLSRQCFLHALVLMNQQRLDDAVRALDEVDATVLEPAQQLRLVRAWAAVEKPERAKATFERISNALEPAEREALEARILIAQEVLPSSLPEDAGVLIAAAWLQLRRGVLSEAARLSMRALEKRSDAMFSIGPFAVLAHALHATVWETSTVIPVPIEMRATVIHTIEGLRRRCLATWVDVAEQTNAKGLDERLRAAAAAYQEAIGEVDPWPELPVIARLRDADIGAATALAERGDIDEAVKAFPSGRSPWVDDLRRAQLLTAVGRLDEARAISQGLVERYPHSAPVQQLVAAHFAEARDYERAVEHARRAYDLVPAGGYRFLLTSCLMAAGRLDEAWALVEPVWRKAGPQTLLLAAELADRRRSVEAPELWAHYVAISEWKAAAHLQHARALFRSHRPEAADEAWEAHEVWLAHGGIAEERVPAMLGLVGRLQLQLQPLSRQRRNRVETIIDELRQLRDNAEGEQVRMMLTWALGRTPEVDVSLLEKAGILRPLSQMDREQLERLLRDEQRWYDAGGISLAGLARARGRSFAVDFVERWSDSTRYFCTPCLDEEHSVLSLVDQEIIVGVMELLVLAKLGALDAFEALAQRLRLCVLIPEPSLVELEDQRGEMPGPSELDREAHRLMELVHDAVTSGWIETLDAVDPSEITDRVPELPPTVVSSHLAEVLQAAPLAERLAQLEAAQRGRPRHILTVDRFGTHGFGNIDLGLAFAWPSAERYDEVLRYLERARPLFVSVPQLVRAMAHEGVLHAHEARRHLWELAQQGFSDALTGKELVASFQEPTLPKVLDGLEARVRHGGVSSAMTGRFEVARIYAEAIVLGALGEPHEDDLEIPPSAAMSMPSRYLRPLPPDARLALLTKLLVRLEALDERGGDGLDVALMHLMAATVDRFRDAFLPSTNDPSTVELRKESLVGELWSSLQAWASDGGSRRTALDRAVCTAWAFIDRHSPESGPGARAWSLFLAETSSHGDDALSLDRECVAILSANWQERPLKNSGRSFTLTQHSKDDPEQVVRTIEQRFDWEHVLERAALAFDELARTGDGRTVVFEYRDDAVPIPLVFHLPAEAVVMRMPQDRLPDGFRFLKDTQGHLDGIAYGLLQQLEREPTNMQLRHAYARHTVESLWRRVRDDPAYLLHWMHKIDESGDAPWSLDNLRRMLHEPTMPITEEKASDVWKQRWQQVWEHLDGFVAYSVGAQAATLPGLHGGLLRPDIDDVAMVAKIVEDAVDVLENAGSSAAGELANAIRCLCMVAVRSPIVELRRGPLDLRTSLPQLVLEALDALDESTGTMGQHETALIRACGLVVHNALRYTPGSTYRDFLWLTYHLYAWLVRQIHVMSPDVRESGLVRLTAMIPLEGPTHALAQRQLFDPFRFEEHRFEYRKAVFLSGLISGFGLVRQEGRKQEDGLELSSPALERRILEIAHDPVREIPALDESWIDWPFPVAVPDLAAYWLLVTNPKRFLSSEPESLIRRIERWPDDVASMRRGDRDLVEVMTRGLAFSLDEQPDSVVDAFVTRLVSLVDDPVVRKLQWMGLTSAFGRGATELEARARELVHTHLDQEHALIYTGFFLSGIIGYDADALSAQLEALLGRADVPNVQATVVLALARIVIHAKQPARARIARAALDSLAQRPELRDDPGLKALLSQLPNPSPP